MSGRHQAGGATRRERRPARLRVTRFFRSRPRLLLAAAAGLLAGLLGPSRWSGVVATLVGWNTGAYLYLALIWTMMARSDQDRVRRVALAQDENTYVVLTLVCVSAVMSVVAIVLELATVKQAGAEHSLHIILTALTVIGGWAMIPTVFTLHYASMFYNARDGAPPLRFPEEHPTPDYVDFLYFAFTIAVASQTADVSVISRSLRKVVLAQSLLAFFFNASILALAINISASLVSP